MLVRHRVDDFETWVRVYKGFASIQREGGVRAQMALRSTEDPRDIVVTHTFDSREDAEAYLSDQRLAKAMEEATVESSTVTIEFFDEVVPNDS